MYLILLIFLLSEESVPILALDLSVQLVPLVTICSSLFTCVYSSCDHWMTPSSPTDLLRNVSRSVGLDGVTQWSPNHFSTRKGSILVFLGLIIYSRFGAGEGSGVMLYKTFLPLPKISSRYFQQKNRLDSFLQNKVVPIIEPIYSLYGSLIQAFLSSGYNSA